MLLTKLKLIIVTAIGLSTPGVGKAVPTNPAPDLPAGPSQTPHAETKPDASLIGFLSRRTGRNIWYTMRPDGSDVRPIFGGKVGTEEIPALTPGTTVYREPHWTRLSPDRKLFLSWVHNLADPGGFGANYTIWAGRVADGKASFATLCWDEQFAWAPDSRRFAFAEQSPRLPSPLYKEGVTSKILIENADGTAARLVLERAGIWTVHDWSSDGDRLLLRMQKAVVPFQEIDARLFELDLKTAKAGKSDEALKQLLPNGVSARPRWFSQPRYSPDGRSIAMINWKPGEKEVDDRDPIEQRAAQFDRETALEVLDIAGGRLRTVAQYPGGLRGPICWAPDGREILFSRALDPGDSREKSAPGEQGLGIWGVAPDGTKERFLTTGWCPDWR